jgi:hypothetical protein
VRVEVVYKATGGSITGGRPWTTTRGRPSGTRCSFPCRSRRRRSRRPRDGRSWTRRGGRPPGRRGSTPCTIPRRRTPLQPHGRRRSRA